jgi:TorA maturation chaperone TorD/NAD-dependent dihydropyrimidine dehydrogenase PreA subunit
VDVDTARRRSRTYADLARAFSEPEPGFEQEFTRLFLGPGRPVAHPYESVYREGRTMGESTLDVRRRLAGEGLAPSGQTLPDYVGIELAFMAHLAAREALDWDAGDRDEALRRLIQEESFLRDHLGTWLPQFCHRILAGRPLTHYAKLAQRAEAFVTRDTASLRAWLGQNAVAGEEIAAGQQWWIVTVGRGCTLCHICVEMCQPGALRGIRDEREGVITLRLDPTRCDGCAACERWCPEGVIRVGTSENAELRSAGELARSELLACPSCGRLHVPRTMIAGLEKRMVNAQESLLQRLLLCYDCKATSSPLARPTAARQTRPDLPGVVSLSGRSR